MEGSRHRRPVLHDISVGTATGDPAFCTFWTLTGLPALNLPILQGEGGLPIGVQLIGARGRDEKLLRTARVMIEQLG